MIMEVFVFSNKITMHAFAFIHIFSKKTNFGFTKRNNNANFGLLGGVNGKRLIT